MTSKLVEVINRDGADLSGADFPWANFYKANLSGAKLSRANFYKANLSGADLSGAKLSRANLFRANLSGANLSGADLHGANLSGADLHGANLSGADLSRANLHETNLSGVKNLLDPIEFMNSTFVKTKDGYIVYKCFGATYSMPSRWQTKAGAIIEEAVNPLRTDACGCGINVATREWVIDNYPYKIDEIWECLIRWEWLPGVVVPYNTDGKIRCSKLELIKIVKSDK